MNERDDALARNYPQLLLLILHSVVAKNEFLRDTVF